MFQRYLKSTFRNLWKNSLYTFINILGLAVGLAGFMLIMIYISGELSYDKHHPDYRNTYRVAMDLEMSGNITKAAVSGGMLGVLMHEEIKEVASYTRLVHYPREVLFTFEEKKLYFDNILFADSSFFDFFTYKTYLGDPSEALRQAYSLVLTRSGAEKIFGDEDPIGRTIQWDAKDTYVVRAVIEDPEYPSHMQFEALASFTTLENIPPFNRFIQSLSAFVTFNYVKLHEGFSPEDIEAPLDSLIQRHMGEDIAESGAGFNFYLQPISDIYLYSHLRHEISTNGNINNLYIFSAVAVFILLIACLNFITLSTARASGRAKEVGVRKVFGAERKGLVGRFLLESILMAFLGMLLAIALVEVMLPEIEQLAGSSLPIRLGDLKNYLGILAGLTIVVGILSGLYPAFVISSYSPLVIIQKRISSGGNIPWFRNTMVVLQFLITIFLICGTIIIYMQLGHMKNKDTGISLEDKLVITLRGRAMIDKYDELRAEFELVKGVEAVTASSSYPGNYRMRRGFYPEGSPRNEMRMLLFFDVNHNYFDVMDINLILGNGFSENADVDSSHIIVNEAMVVEAGWDDPLGKFVAIPGEDESSDQKFTVIGVVRDYNYASLHETIKPLLIFHQPGRLSNITVEFTPSGFSETLSNLEQKWDDVFPQQPFNYFILEAEFEHLYSADIKLSEVFVWFTLLAVFIACMGLFGLSSFMTSERTREIGIRKVLGSSSPQVVFLFVKTFFMLILVSAVLAVPLAWYAMHEWLQNFSDRTPMYWWIFPAATLLALLVAGITVASQSVRAASRNPVDAIRWE